MSRSNKNNRKKLRLSRNDTNEQPLRCSSSSGSSNYSDDMDLIRNAVLESLMKNAGAAAVTTTTTPTSKPTFDDRYRRQLSQRRRQGKSDDESRADATMTTTTAVDTSATKSTPPVAAAPAPATTIEELPTAATVPLLGTQPDDDDQIRTDVKIVRVKTLDSEESKLLLIVDVLDRNPFRIEVNNQPATASKRRRDEDGKCIKVDIEALKRGECPKEIRNLRTKVRSRRIYKLPDELMRKFDQKGLKVFEWHSFNRPDEVIKLLLDDCGGAGAAGTSDAAVESSATAATADVLRKRMIIGFRRRSPTAASEGSLVDEEPPAKKTMTASQPPDPVGEVEPMKSGVRKSRLANDQRSRNRILQKLLKEYSISGAGAGNPTNVWDTANQSKINRLVRSHLGLRAKEASERANNRRKELNDVTPSTTMAVAPRSSNEWKSTSSKRLANAAVAGEFSVSTMKRDNRDAAKLSLNDDNDASVSNSNADVTAIDGNSDALNNSNNDDNDAKAKKKNRCALCRKKVGLTGFECRCGGLYCGIHRYSDKHNCTFDYRQLGAQEIRRNNPVVVGEKIQKI